MDVDVLHDVSPAVDGPRGVQRRAAHQNNKEIAAMLRIRIGLVEL